MPIGGRQLSIAMLHCAALPCLPFEFKAGSAASFGAGNQEPAAAGALFFVGFRAHKIDRSSQSKAHNPTNTMMQAVKPKTDDARRASKVQSRLKKRLAARKVSLSAEKSAAATKKIKLEEPKETMPAPSSPPSEDKKLPAKAFAPDLSGDDADDTDDSVVVIDTPPGCKKKSPEIVVIDSDKKLSDKKPSPKQFVPLPAAAHSDAFVDYSGCVCKCSNAQCWKCSKGEVCPVVEARVFQTPLRSKKAAIDANGESLCSRCGLLLDALNGGSSND